MSEATHGHFAVCRPLCKKSKVKFGEVAGKSLPAVLAQQGGCCFLCGQPCEKPMLVEVMK